MINADRVLRLSIFQLHFSSWLLYVSFLMCFDYLPGYCRCIIETKWEFVGLFKCRPCASFIHFVSVDETLCFVHPLSSWFLL